jgi:four helix bundle protein
MGTFQSFEEIDAWQRARELRREIYAISAQAMLSKDFGLRDQIRKASVSNISNIAEGFDRGGTSQFLQSLSIAKGSAGEVRTHFYVAHELGYVAQETFERISAQAVEIGRMIGRLMSYLRGTKIRGTKYKPETRNE